MQIRVVVMTSLVALLMQCIVPAAGSEALGASDEAVPPALEKMTPVDAWTAVGKMTPGINIGNTLENTAKREVGWGNPPITKEYVQTLARLGFKSVRLPVAWDTYADNGRITPQQFHRVGEVVNWITDAGMYCVVNIHFAWLGAFSPAPNMKAPGQLLPDPARARDLKLLWLSCGKQDSFLGRIQGMHRYLLEHNVPHVWHVDGHGHDAAEWKPCLYHFAQLVFRSSAERIPGR